MTHMHRMKPLATASPRGAWVGATFALVWAFGASAADLNKLDDIKIAPTPGGAEVVVNGSQAPTFTVFRLSDPDRLVVDLSSADASAIKGHRDGVGPVAGVVTSQFADDRSHVGRVLVALGDSATYDVRASGNKVVIAVKGGNGLAAPAPAASKPSAAAKVEASKPVVVAEASPVADAPAAVDTAAAPSATDSNVVASAADEQVVKHPAKKVTALKIAKDTLTVGTDGEVARYELLELTDPPRLALDLYGVSMATKAPKNSSAYLKEVRVGAHGDKVRLVMDVRGAMPAYRAIRQRHGIQVVMGNKVAAAPALPLAAATAKAGSDKASGEMVAEIDGQRIELDGNEASPPAHTPPAAAPKKQVDLEDLKFEESASGGKLTLKLSSAAEFKVDRPDEHSAVLTLDSVRIPKRLERSLDTSALGTPVKMVSAFAVPGKESRVRVVVAAEGSLSEEVAPSGNALVWKLSSDKKTATAEVALTANKTAGFSSEAPAYADEAAPRQGHTKYTGRRVSFEFKDIDIQNLLRVIAEVSRKNVVVADDVQGKVTIRLRNVPWDQALELILRSKGLGKEEIGNIVRVAPLKTLEEEAKLREERRRAQIRQEELVVQLVPVNYAVALDMSARVKEVLSERGSVAVDTRTNTLIVRDVASNINRARALVQNLDTQTPQVLIESRIVEANTNFTRSLGVQWGGQGTLSPATGNPTGLAFPNTFGVSGGVAGTSPGSPAAPNYAVNLPAAVGAGQGGALGFIFGTAGGALNINLRLSALENEGAVKTISAPKVTTLDNTTARISQGLSIPFSQVSAAGVNTTFIEARLSLEVTPHITQDGSILMNIRAENNQPDPSNTGANGQPAIQRKEANTQVLVKDGETTVIGGIYVRRGSTQVSMVPFLGRIPILGFFFKTNTESESRQELLIFITPRIINRQTIAQTL